jgi:hypothetical protein
LRRGITLGCPLLDTKNYAVFPDVAFCHTDHIGGCDGVLVQTFEEQAIEKNS